MYKEAGLPFSEKWTSKVDLALGYVQGGTSLFHCEYAAYNISPDARRITQALQKTAVTAQGHFIKPLTLFDTWAGLPIRGAPSYPHLEGYGVT